MMRCLCLLFISLILNTAYAQKEVYNVGMLLDQQSQDLRPLLDQLQSEIIAVVGEDAEVRFPAEGILSNDQDLNKAETNYQRLLSGSTDIILAFGVFNNEVISRQSEYPKPTILFGAVDKDMSSLDLSNATSGIHNFTYLIESTSYLDDLSVFHELSAFNTVGLAVDRATMSLLDLKKGLFESDSFTCRFIPLDDVDDIVNELDKVDALYMADGFFMSPEEVTTLADRLIDKGVPSLTANGVDQVELGLMATTRSENNLQRFFRRLALTIEGYINGADLAQMPVYIDNVPRLSVNYNTANLLGIPIKYSLLSSIDFVGEFKNFRAERTFGLVDYVNGVLNQNLQLQTSKVDIDLRGQDVEVAKANYKPKVVGILNGQYTDPDVAEGSGGQNPEFLTTGTVSLEQTIFSEAANANIDIQKQLLKAQEASYSRDQLDLISSAVSAYLSALVLKANGQIQLGNLELTRNNLELAEQNFRAGQSGKSDLLRFESQLAQNTQTTVEAVNGIEQAFIGLNQLMNNPLDMEIDIEDVQLDDQFFSTYNYDLVVDLLDDPTTRDGFINFLVDESMKNSPELRQLDYNLDAVERSVRLYGSGRYLPTVALQGQYNQFIDRSGKGSDPLPGRDLLDKTYNVGLSVSLPIINQGLSNINKQTALKEQSQLELAKENQELALASDVRRNILDVVNQISNIELSRVSESTAKEALELTQVAYSSGSIGVIQLIDAQTNYLNAQLARTAAVYNYLMSTLEVERSMGYYFMLNSEADNQAFVQRFVQYLNNN